MFQLGLHLVNAVLTFLVLSYFLSPKSALFLALIFLVHPINSEVVVYVSGFQDTLFLFFGLLALYLTIKEKFKNFYLLPAIFLLFSLLSKETGVVFLIIIFIYLLFLKKREILPFSIASFLILTIYAYLRFFVAGIFLKKHGLSPITQLSFLERVISIRKIIFYYLKTFLFPKDLMINQHWFVTRINFSDFYLPLLIDILFFAVLTCFFFHLLLKKQKNKASVFLFFFIWFISGLGFHLHIFPLDLTVSDRWFYFPVIGLLAMMGLMAEKIPAKRLSFCLTIILIILLSVRTFVRTFDWRDGLTLYSHDIKIAQKSFDLENNLGVELFRRGDFPEAKIHFENSTRLAPGWWTNWNNLGAIYEREKNFVKAKEYYQKSIDNGNYYLAYENLASLLLFKNNNPSEAKEFSLDVLRKLPNNSKVWLILALAEYQLGNKNQALLAAGKAWTLNPNQQNYYIFSRLQNNLPLEFNTSE